jgi:hypothetical protein
MKNALLRGVAERKKNPKKRITKIALVLCLAVFGTAIEAQAECQNVVGGIMDVLIPAPNDPFGRILGNVNGVLNGAVTTFLDSLSPDGIDFTSIDVFVTNRGDMLTATGSGTQTPVPTNPSEQTINVTLTITGGSGKYDGATGMITLTGLAQNVTGAPGVGSIFETYRGSVCGPNVKDGRHDRDDRN